MKTTLPLAIAVSIFLLAPRLEAEPPFSGTIFIDPDIIRSSDPTAFLAVTDKGRGQRQMFDRRVNDWVNLNAYLSQATFDDGLAIEVQVNPEFGSAAAALVEAGKYSTVIGRLPKGLRIQVATVWIHKGTQPFGGGNNNLLIHTGQADDYAASGILEETLVHEASHTSLDAAHAGAAGWLAAQAADKEFISTYARDNPTREDIAESFLPYLALRYRAGRISASLANTIAQAIPNRIAYFDSQLFDLNPFPGPGISVVRVGPEALTLSWPWPSTGWKLQQNTTPIGGEWTTPVEPIDSNGVIKSVTVNVTGGDRYFRLAK